MFTVAATSSQNHMSDNPMSGPSAIYHMDSSQKKFKRMSLSDERLAKVEPCQKVRPSMQQPFRQRSSTNKNPTSNLLVPSDNGNNQLPNSVYRPKELMKQEFSLDHDEPSHSSFEENFSRKEIIPSDENLPFACYDETNPENIYDETKKLTRSYYPSEGNDFLKKKRFSKETSSDSNEEESNSACDHCTCDRIIFNVSGQIYETRSQTLERFPETLLGNPEKRQEFYDPARAQYFFDRDRPSFDGILNFYQNGGRLRRPLSVNIDVFAEEIKFYQLGVEAMTMYQEMEGYDYTEEDFKLFNKETVPKFLEKKEKLPSNEFQRKVWLLFEKPESSNAARIVAIVSIFVIFLSIVCFCLETLPQFQVPKNGANNTAANFSNNSVTASSQPAFVKDPFWIIETFCIVWFTVELLSRFLSCPEKTRFWLDILNVIDLVAIIPYFVSTGSAAMDHAKGRTGSKGVSLAFFRVVRLVRVFRIFKLSRHSVGLQILGKTLKSSGSELALLLFFVLIGVVTFSSAIYFAEIDAPKVENEPSFDSIPDAFWWAIVTMTTVGYGDMYPRTFAGKLIGSVCALCGILCLALPVPVIVSNFMFFYRRAKTKQHQSSSGL